MYIRIYSYEKILVDISSFLRGLHFDNKHFLDYIKVVDDTIIDMCPLYDKFEDKYNEMFIIQKPSLLYHL